MFVGDLSSGSLPAPPSSSGSSRPSSLDSAARFHFCSFGRQDAHGRSTATLQISGYKLHLFRKSRQMNTCRNEERKLPGMSTYENYPGGGVPCHVASLRRRFTATPSSTTAKAGSALFHYISRRTGLLIARSRSLDHKTISEREPSQNQHLQKNTRGGGSLLPCKSQLADPHRAEQRPCFHPVPARRYASPISSR